MERRRYEELHNYQIWCLRNGVDTGGLTLEDMDPNFPDSGEYPELPVSTPSPGPPTPSPYPESDRELDWDLNWESDRESDFEILQNEFAHSIPNEVVTIEPTGIQSTSYEIIQTDSILDPGGMPLCDFRMINAMSWNSHPENERMN